MNTRVAILSAIPAELNGFPEEDWESQILYTGVGKINATKALMEHAGHLRNWNYSIINYGTAAKVSDKVEVGKLYEVTNFIQRDMDVTPLGFQNYETPWGNRNISFLTTLTLYMYNFLIFFFVSLKIYMITSKKCIILA